MQSLLHAQLVQANNLLVTVKPVLGPSQRNSYRPTIQKLALGSTLVSDLYGFETLGQALISASIAFQHQFMFSQ